MNACFVIKKSLSYNAKKVEYAEIKLSVPDITIKQYIIPYKDFLNIKYKKVLNKVSKNEKIYDEYKGTKSDKNLIDRMLFHILEYIFKIYGLKKRDTEIAVVTGEETNLSLVEDIGKFARFLVVYGINSNNIFEEIFNKNGLCVRYENNNIPKDKIVINLVNDIEIYVSGKKYNDLEIVWNYPEKGVENRVFDYILREFATKDDIDFMFKKFNVKKMVLKSK